MMGQQLPSDDPAAYGDRHAPVYDQIYGGRFPPSAAVGTLVAAGRDGGVLELGVGTGRLAIPLAARGMRVDGIEASPAMVRELRARPGGDAVGVVIADLTGFDLPHKEYGAAVCAAITGPAVRSARTAPTRSACTAGPGKRASGPAAQPGPVLSHGSQALAGAGA